MFETMALHQPPRDPLQVPGTVLRWTRYALALDDETMAVPQPAAPANVRIVHGLDVLLKTRRGADGAQLTRK